MKEQGLTYIKKALGTCMVAAMALSVFPALTSCMTGKYLKTEGAEPAEVKGTYTLILYGCRYHDDIENAAILAKEESGFTFEIYAPQFEYKIKKGIAAEDALKEAEKFIRCSFYFRQSQLRSILDPEGNAVGYELRPLYSPIEFGISDVLSITYSVKNGKVVVFVRLDSDVERALSDGGEPFLFKNIMRRKR